MPANLVTGHAKDRFLTLVGNVEYQIDLVLAPVLLVVSIMSQRLVVSAVAVVDMSPRKEMERYETSEIGTGKDLSHRRYLQLEILIDQSVAMVHRRRGVIPQPGVKAALRTGHAHLGENLSRDPSSTVHRLLPSLIINGGRR